MKSLGIKCFLQTGSGFQSQAGSIRKGVAFTMPSLLQELKMKHTALTIYNDRPHPLRGFALKVDL